MPDIDLPSVLAALEDDMSPDAAASFAAIAADYLADTRSGDGPVSTPLGAGEIAARFDEPLPRAGLPLAEVAERVRRDVVADANRLYHPMYVGHQVSAPLPAAVWSEVVTAVLNQSVAVWEMSPTLTVLETRVVRWFADLAGLGPAAGGTLTSGGTEATFTALLAARSAAIPDVWTNGVGAEPPVVVCGEHAHYAVARAAGAMGLGLRGVVTIPSRDQRMDVDALARTLGELEAGGRRVMAVVATAGSTATGSFDDLPAIADLCDERGLWLHVDGAHGASALLSPTRRDLVRGIGRARSLAWDPHKMLLLPLSAGMVLVRDESLLGTAFAQQAPYLFHAESGERSWDMGPRSFQCSRRGDVLKLWVALQRYGADGLGLLFDRLCDAARTLHEAIAGRADFESMHAPDCNILCFRYIPSPVLDGARLDLLTQRIRERYNRSGAGWITATTLDGRRVLRVTIMNPRTSNEHLLTLLDGLAAQGRAIAAELAGEPVTATPGTAA
ncbi:MAG: pyridoxal phosphate-dependent decarboxylase family protein [Gemmatimonadaceae bacterium]